VTPAVQIEVIKDDPVDNRILECAVSAGADYIGTGDKDLLRLGSHDAIKILRVADFLNIAQGQGQKL
jgi:predicted nucleic acid-binding protein